MIDTLLAVHWALLGYLGGAAFEDDQLIGLLLAIGICARGHDGGRGSSTAVAHAT